MRFDLSNLYVEMHTTNLSNSVLNSSVVSYLPKLYEHALVDFRIVLDYFDSRRIDLLHLIDEPYYPIEHRNSMHTVEVPKLKTKSREKLNQSKIYLNIFIQ